MQCDRAGHRDLQLRSHLVSEQRHRERKRHLHSISLCRHRDGDCNQHAGPDEIEYGIGHRSVVAAAVLPHHHLGQGGLQSVHRQHQRNLAVQCSGKGHRKLQLRGYVVR
jgi:hypothetical protein